jgi:CRP/FNR family transcriptional regulator, cyclic AMP receptor protein
MQKTGSSSDDAPQIERALRLTQGFASWSPAAMSRLVSSSDLMHHARGDLLTSEAGACATFSIVSGHVLVGRARRHAAPANMFLLGPGALVGLAQMIDREDPIIHSYHAHDEVVAVHMPTQLLFEILDCHPLSWRNMLSMVMSQHGEMRESLLGQAIGSLRSRLAATIDRLATAYGTDVGGTLRLRARQDDLASILQVTRQSLSKELRALVASRVIGTKYNAITILNVEALRKVASHKQGA